MKFASETMYFEGSDNMMYQPEYADIREKIEFIKLRPSSGQTRAIVVDKTFADLRCQIVVAKTPLENPIPNSR